MDTLTLDYNFLMAEAVGEEHGIRDIDLDFVRKRAGRFARDLRRQRKVGEFPFLTLAYDRPTQDRVAAIAEQVRARFRNLVVLGIGGSSLGTAAAHQALSPWIYNVYPPKGSPRIFILDNIDPRYVGDVLEVLDPAETAVNVISKSGTTTETLAQYMIFRKWLGESVGSAVKSHVFVTTDPEKGPLREIAAREGFATFEVPPGVGGRFSVLSPVGLFPAACVGIDIKALCEGAAHMDDRCRVDSMEENPALLYGALMYLMTVRKRKSIHVAFSYSNRLYGLADWYRQLLAESLGKRYDLDGKEVRVGATPIKSLGVTDQHSQVQLYVEGPNDKVFTFFKVEDHGLSLGVPTGIEEHASLSYLGGHSLAEIMEAERVGTELALKRAERPSCTLMFPKVTPGTVGQYFMLMQLAIMVMGRYFKVNPFDQPGVEEGKLAAFALLGRPGYEEKRAEIVAGLEKDLGLRV